MSSGADPTALDPLRNHDTRILSFLSSVRNPRCANLPHVGVVAKKTSGPHMEGRLRPSGRPGVTAGRVKFQEAFCGINQVFLRERKMIFLMLVLRSVDWYFRRCLIFRCYRVSLLFYYRVQTNIVRFFVFAGSEKHFFCFYSGNAACRGKAAIQRQGRYTMRQSAAEPLPAATPLSAAPPLSDRFGRRP